MASSFLQGFLPSEWMENDPSVLYLGALELAGKNRTSNAFKEYFRGQTGNIYNQYLGQIGSRALMGAAPSKTAGFTDYLADYPWLKNFQKLSPAQRGEQPARFAPRLRYNLA